MRGDPIAVAPLLPQLDGVLFDCDGVLVDSERITSRVWAGLLTGYGMPTTTEESLATYLGNSMARCLEIVEDRFGRTPPDDLLPRFYADVKVALATEVTPVAGIVALLNALEIAGVPYGVASNGEHDKMRTTLGATGLLPRFEGRRFSAVDVARPKPAPDLFLHAAQVLGFDPSRTIVVEDSPLGVRGAHAAGMTVIGFAELVAPERLLAAGAACTVAHLSHVLPLLVPAPASAS
ncbi:MAG: HAD family hydrolase [Gemmatimonas sp.]|jgi:HAD superfamily hydrolase (TIGR01509 family)|uniref:HAD family hydrolase n=1 Tax=Gemmatimonas sp. TaxID=1962908 RepID=UPI00391F78D3